MPESAVLDQLVRFSQRPQNLPLYTWQVREKAFVCKFFGKFPNRLHSPIKTLLPAGDSHPPQASAIRQSGLPTIFAFSAPLIIIVLRTFSVSSGRKKICAREVFNSFLKILRKRLSKRLSTVPDAQIIPLISKTSWKCKIEDAAKFEICGKNR